MEQKNLTQGNYLSQVTYQLKEKKNWFIVSVSIMFITLVAVPLALSSRVSETSMVFGILEIAALVFISLLIDFSYLHENRKLSYYFSKPASRLQRFSIILVSNALYATVLLAFLAVIGLFSETARPDLLSFFLLFSPWVYILILIGGLSSLLAGNTIAAGVATVVNFTLPLSLLGVIHFGFDIVGNLTNGFNTRVLFSLFTENIYRIDVLYFIRYFESGWSPGYILVGLFWLLILGSLTVYTINRRQDEKSGEFIVFDGYKNMISVLFASLVPIAFYSILGFSPNVFNKLFSFIILSALTYYLIHAILEKSFKITKPALLIYSVFILSFGGLLLTTNVAAKTFESVVPDPSEISSVYIDYRNHVWAEERERMVDVYGATEEMIANSPDAVLLRDKENIENVISLHREIVKNHDFYLQTNLVIVYFYHDGSTLYRYYNLQQRETYDRSKDPYFLALLGSEEYKNQKLPYIFNDTFFDQFEADKTRILAESLEYSRQDTDIALENFDPEIFRLKYRNDYQKVLEHPDMAISMLFFNRYDDYFKRTLSQLEEDIASSEAVRGFYLEFISGQELVRRAETITFRINSHFNETYNYLLLLKEKGAGAMEHLKENNTIESSRNNEIMYDFFLDHTKLRIV